MITPTNVCPGQTLLEGSFWTADARADRRDRRVCIGIRIREWRSELSCAQRTRPLGLVQVATPQISDALGCTMPSEGQYRAPWILAAATPAAWIYTGRKPHSRRRCDEYDPRFGRKSPATSQVPNFQLPASDLPASTSSDLALADLPIHSSGSS